MDKRSFFYVFVWCFVLALTAATAAGKPIYLSGTGIAGFLGTVLAVFAFSWVLSWLFGKIRPTSDSKHFRGRWAVTAAIVVYSGSFSELSEDRQEQAVVVAFAMIIAVIALKLARRFAARTSRWWWTRSQDFRLWGFASIFWSLGTFLYFWISDPVDAGSLQDLVDDYGFRVFGTMMVPPIFFGGAWFGYRRFVRDTPKIS